MLNTSTKLLDCTLRDGGYYTNWDFDLELLRGYFEAMDALNVDFIEVGFRSISNQGFKGGFAYSTDKFLKSFSIPVGLKGKIAVMVNATELVSDNSDMNLILSKLFKPQSESCVRLVRIACHADEFVRALPAANWLKSQGYLVGFNIMQIAERSDEDIVLLIEHASKFPIDVLYFADSMGSLAPQQVKHIVSLIRSVWAGEIGIHTHDNMNQALANTIAAVETGSTWVDSTVSGMGRGAGNVQTEYLALALAERWPQKGNITRLLEVVRKYFKPMQAEYGWGVNPYYYLAGLYGIHPSYIQYMLSDNRFTEEDILAVIDHLKVEGGKKFSLDTLDAARHFYSGDARGSWDPKTLFEGQDVLLLGSGPGVGQHRLAIEDYIHECRPIVMALNTQSSIDQKLIDMRVACHPIRLLADCDLHAELPQPLITPASMLPKDVLDSLGNKHLLDFGLKVQCDSFDIKDHYCILPNSLVLAYALAVLSSGRAKRVFLAGFDGYSADDPRQKEVEQVFNLFDSKQFGSEIVSITPTRFEVPIVSVYALGGGL